MFDPTILAALEHAGYDHSFERVAAGDGVRNGSAERCGHRTIVRLAVTRQQALFNIASQDDVGSGNERLRSLFGEHI